MKFAIRKWYFMCTNRNTSSNIMFIMSVYYFITDSKSKYKKKNENKKTSLLNKYFSRFIQNLKMFKNI